MKRDRLSSRPANLFRMPPPPPLQHQYLVIEGNIGAGKTTLSKMLAEEFGTRLILEEFSDNPFLPLFYDNPERYAFSVELFFMMERHKQLQQHLTQTSLFEPGTIADYFFLKTLLFAQINLKDDEWRLFQRLFHSLNAGIPKPDLLVYLHRSPDDLRRNIVHRGRAYEQSISVDYLETIQRGYLDYFKTVTDFPILIIDVEGVHFWKKPEEYRQLRELIDREYETGIHHRKLSGLAV